MGSSDDRAPHAPGLIDSTPLRRLLRPVRAKMFGCAVLSAFAAAAGLAPYLAVAEIARALLNPSDPTMLARTVWLWVVIGSSGACLRLALLFSSSRLGHYADAQTLHDLRVQIVKQLGRLPLGWFRTSGAGAVKKVMTTDLEEMHQLIAHALGEITAAVTAMVVSFTYLVLIDWRMAMSTLAVLVLMWVSYKIAMRSVNFHVKRLLHAEGRISAASVEYADGIAVVKTFGMGGPALHRFAVAVREHTEALGAWVRETRYSSAISRLLASEMMVLGVVMSVGLWLMSSGSLALADLVPFLVVAVGLPTAIMPAIQGSQGLRKGRMAAGNIERLLAREPLAEPPAPQTPVGSRIELDCVSFSYAGSERALENISATLESGTLTALVGPSGAGKTTLASLLARFYDVTEGAIRIGGVDVRSMSSKTLLSHMSLVFQDVILLRESITENIRIGRSMATDDEVRRAACAAHINEVIQKLPRGYDTVLDGSGGGLSGGERQRLTIARAMLSAAPIVILDEATAALDPDNEAAVQSAVTRLVAGKTVIVVAHRLRTIMHADQILVLDRGRVVERGTHDELLHRGGLYARLWHAQEPEARP